MFQFSQDQHSAISGICSILVDSPKDKHAVCVLTGPAGTGKSTVVSEIIERISANSTRNIELCATTHRAAAVLKEIVGLPVSTGYSAFKLQPGVTALGKETLKSSGVCKIPHGSVLIMDESSMLGDTFIRAVFNTIKDRCLKILFVGDPFQLPPTSDQCSLFDGSIPTFTLTTVHRQAGGNPVLEKANEFREFIDGSRFQEPVLQTAINAKGEGIHVLPHADFVTKFVQKYISYKPGDEVDIPLCTFTNSSAMNYNSMIRKAAYFAENKIEPYYVGERLVANSVVMRDKTTVITNNETVYVKEYRPGVLSEIPGYYVTVKGEYNSFTKTDTATVFCAKTIAAADKVLKEYKSIAIQNKSKPDWVRYYALKNSLADLRPPFAGTTHKAQGGTFPAVFIDQTNINQCSDAATRARLLYVALTRASKNVYINS